jgi:HTH-type transcriptional regulator / antitoxin HigA
MNLQDVQAHWVALHESLALGAPFKNEAQYERALTFVEQIFVDVAGDPNHPLEGLLDLLADRIREYEDRVHPWPDTSTPITVLRSLMEEHGLTQSDMPEIGAQSVVSAVLAGKRELNLRQIKGLAQRFSVPLDVFA